MPEKKIVEVDLKINGTLNVKKAVFKLKTKIDSYENYVFIQSSIFTY